MSIARAKGLIFCTVLGLENIACQQYISAYIFVRYFVPIFKKKKILTFCVSMFNFQLIEANLHVLKCEHNR